MGAYGREKLTKGLDCEFLTIKVIGRLNSSKKLLMDENYTSAIIEGPNLQISKKEKKKVITRLFFLGGD